MSVREHGTLAMRTRGDCRTNPCQPCLDAGQAYARKRVYLRATGRPAYADATRARVHVQQLLAAGMTIRQVEASSGVHRTAIRVMLGDFPGRKQSKRITFATERALLHTALVVERPVGDATVDATGTRRRLEALQAIGYPARDLARRLGAGPTSPLQVAKKSRVRAATARAVADLYTQIENIPGPSHRVAVAARARGFLTPAWWDPDDINNPDQRPSGIRLYENQAEGWTEKRAGSNRLLDVVDAPRLARIELLASRGLSRGEIAARLGVPIRYVSRDLLAAAAGDIS